MILLIIYINYLLFYLDFYSLLYAIPFFFAFYWSMYLVIKKSKKIINKDKDFNFHEIKYTISSIFVFWSITYIYFKLFELGIINFSFKFWVNSIIMWIIFTIFHDIYFYFIHAFAHTKVMMKKVHIIHHISHHTSVLTSYSLHPIESFLYALITLIVFIDNINFYSILIPIFFQDYFTILGHSWYEVSSNKIKNTFLFKYFMTSTNHSIHHAKNNWNYGLYFLYLDNFFNTISKDNEEIFDKVTK